MNHLLAGLKGSSFHRWYKRYEKFAPIIFFIGGFIFDTLTLGRIDRLYDVVVLCLYMTLLTLSLYLYNLVDDGRWKGTHFQKYENYLPLVIQFFFGGLSSAYVIYFSRSVSVSKTASFFIILVILFLANEFLKKRISNKYLQFAIYSFISFTFFAFMIPVFIKEMNPTVFLISGGVSLTCTLILAISIYNISPSTRAEMQLRKLIPLILCIYGTICVFYFLKLIPPVPLALEKGIVAHEVHKENNSYVVTYEQAAPNIFWREYRSEIIIRPGEPVYFFSSVFAPTALKKSIIHQWSRYSEEKEKWEIVENISFEITGGRDAGYRGYTFKTNVWEGHWKVEVITSEDHILGFAKFDITIDPGLAPKQLTRKTF
ncbi:DUF2914 domain-containing protein [Robertkochia flava]|uniref:DUF2914 domain-containing protein n=1 Tax=Robertkochia flava TaxID=3447986 RepID=UPI001CCEC463|nr:DUF2914 domain-containing protein [Robertkochia marina]